MDAATLSRIATVVAQVDGVEERCTPCWMAAHVACERGSCACSDERHAEHVEIDRAVAHG